ncbi:hypothetical protein F5X99DRAFT_234410 [Biscogniauxia marginata]|nr:hypothetical protein F5X99DRAFT_234410 [Biscogniauxia marginata]
MERDTRRDRSQWRGCHRFDNIICDGDQVGNSKRNGGLKMGQTYYYYYELDGCTETHDPSLPTTTTCPYLPGQTVNTLEVPREQQLRLRSASMNSLRSADFKTMDPQAKFTTPRPAPPVPGAPEVRVGTSPSAAPPRSARSLSPAPRWTGAARRFFGLRPQSRGSDRGRSSVEGDHDSLSVSDSDRLNQSRSATPSGSIRSRDMSPESLRRFLSDDLPCTPPTVEPPPRLSIPDDIVEENEDDDNFATSAASENAPFTTLSPPPCLKSLSTPSAPAGQNQSTATIVPETPLSDTDATPVPAIRSMIPDFKLDIRQSHFSFSTISSGLASPTSPQSTESRDFSQVSFFDDLDDEEREREEEGEEAPSNTSGSFAVQGSHRDVDEPKQNLRYATQEPFTGYSLPEATTTTEKVKHLNISHLSVTALGSPALVARNENGVPVGNTALLSRPGYDGSLDDLVSDMSWMADVILPKDI